MQPSPNGQVQQASQAAQSQRICGPLNIGPGEVLNSPFTQRLRKVCSAVKVSRLKTTTKNQQQKPSDCRSSQALHDSQGVLQ